MRHRNLNAEIADLLAALTAPASAVERAAQTANEADNLRASPQPVREVKRLSSSDSRTRP
jgi:hypothetical protein